MNNWSRKFISILIFYVITCMWYILFSKRYWQEYNEYKRQLLEFQEDQRSVDNQLRYTQTQLERLNKTNVFNSTFHIWYVFISHGFCLQEIYPKSRSCFIMLRYCVLLFFPSNLSARIPSVVVTWTSKQHCMYIVDVLCLITACHGISF